MNKTVPTVIVSAFPASGKTTLAALYPRYFRDFESTDYRWMRDKLFDPSDESVAENPNWPQNYIDDILRLEKSGMYQKVFITSHQIVRAELCKRGIRYTNIVPENTSEMKKIMLDRMKNRGSTETFIQNMDQHWDEYVNSMLNDNGAANVLQLTPQIIDRWGELYCLE